MDRQIFFLLLLVAGPLLLLHCSKEEEQMVPQDLVYQSLVAEKDTIAPDETTKVTATATGSRLEYFWSATLGDIVGQGAEVTYVASPCHVGKNEITCKITNGDQSESKTLEIVVL